jgi:plastocyanin
MQNKFMKLLMICLGLLLVLSACAGLQQQVPVGSVEGAKTITMEADSFKFTPNNIKASQGDELTIKITNVADTGHDFTIKDPQRQVIKSMDLPSKQTVEIKITLSEAGEYDFYCDKPFHSLFGMKGQIEVVKK